MNDRDREVAVRAVWRPGFTLLETMLAVVLGSLVILAAFGLFTTIQRSEKRAQLKMEENLELATAHRAIMRAFHLLLMSDEQPPNEKEVDEFLKDDDRRNSDAIEDEDEDAASTRLALQPDINNQLRMTIGDADRPRVVRSQVMRLTLRDTPIVGDGQKTEAEMVLADLDRQRYLSRAAQRLGERGAGKSSGRRSGGSGAGGDLDSALAAADRAAGGAGGGEGSNMDSGRTETRRGGRGRELALRPRRDSAESGRGAAGRSRSDREEDRDDRTASERLEDEEEARPRAPGVRGVFEILPDGQVPGGGEDTTGRTVSIDQPGVDGGPTYSLWWRELPPIEIDPLSDPTPAAAGEEVDDEDADGSRRAASGTLDGAAIDRQVQRLANMQDASGKRVRLLSGMKSIHWTAFRGRKEREKITAKYDRHLPAFVELELVTAGGRRENWIFDVAWTIGPEPGSVMPEPNDPLNGGLAGIDGQGGPTVDTDGDGVPDSPGPGGGSPSTGGGGKPTGKPTKPGKGGNDTQKPIPGGNPKGGGGGSSKPVKPGQKPGGDPDVSPIAK